MKSNTKTQFRVYAHVLMHFPYVLFRANAINYYGRIHMLFIAMSYARHAQSPLHQIIHIVI